MGSRRLAMNRRLKPQQQLWEASQTARGWVGSVTTTARAPGVLSSSVVARGAVTDSDDVGRGLAATSLALIPSARNLIWPGALGQPRRGDAAVAAGGGMGIVRGRGAGGGRGG